MNKFLNIFKIIFHFYNILVIFFYLFPGSLLGWFFYGNIKKQKSFTGDFKSDLVNISSNHFYAFFFLSFLGILSYSKNKKLNLVIIYLFFIALVLELLQIFIPYRAFQFEDLLGNIVGTLCVVLIYKILKIKN